MGHILPLSCKYHTYIYMCMSIHTHTCICTRVYIHMYTHTPYIHIYLYTNIWFVTLYCRLFLFKYSFLSHWGHIFYKENFVDKARTMVDSGRCYANKIICMKWMLLLLPFCPPTPDQPDPNNLYWLLNFSWEIKQLSRIAVINDNFLQKHV